MKSTTNDFTVPTTVNYVQNGNGAPVILIHGGAASLHDWDDLVPELTRNGYASYALDLLGHGDSPKPASRAYHIDWVFEHFLHWMRSLRLTEPAILIGHSLGGYIALEYARRVSAWTRGLILVSPFYSRLQLPPLLRRSYSNRNLRGVIAEKTPQWMFRAIVDVTSRAMGHSAGALHSLPEHIRAQTALDYTRTAPGVYNIPSVLTDLTEHLHSISLPTLVVWGDRDQTLAPESFTRLVDAMPRAEGRSVRAGHVPHQSNAKEFNEMVTTFISRLG
ncbi:MAG TPA: alpha/beta hydrolase [Anaerolineales bacterium]|nr:alpha/beta hydrolase [Anaerolineales bacterium]